MTTHQFADEWLLRVVESLPGVDADRIRAWRTEGREFLAQALLDAGLITVPSLAELVRRKYHIDSVDVNPRSLDAAVLALVPEAVRRRHRVIPVLARPGEITVAMINPLDPFAADAVRAATGRNVVPCYCPPAQLREVLAEQVNPETLVFDLARAFGERETVEVLERESESESLAETNNIRPPVVQLVDAMITKAVHQRASDVHIEHEETSSMVRFRVDGLLRNVLVLPRYVAAGPLVSRIKIMAGLDVSNHFHPQDGRAKLRVGRDVVGLRVSTLPSRNGEKVVLRILNESAVQVPLPELGFRADVLARFRALLSREQGVVLVTGPTGSGKTTTLYAALNELRSESVNVVTVEDPIEYRLDGITQVQVNEKQGLTFPAVLRSVLRQDPDVILLGEIRDRETANVAMQAALTGHLMLSTLHTNDTVGAVERLADIGIERFKLASGLAGATAQRLVRRLCPECAVPDPDACPSPIRTAMARLGLEVRAARAPGCDRCGYSGFRGRLPLIELLEITAALRERISAGVAPEALYQAALQAGAVHPMEADALWHVSQGHTTWSEVEAYVDVERLEQVLGADTTTAPLPPLAAAPATAPAAARTRLLIGVGDPVWQAVIPAAVATLDYEIEQFQDGAALLGAIARATPAGVVVGPGLATLDARQVIEAVRKVLGMVELPVVAISTSADEQQLRASGAGDVLTPPVDAAALAARIHAALDRRTMWSGADEVRRPPTPLREAERLAALYAAGILDTPDEERFDRITRTATEQLGVPIALVSIVDQHRQWFKSKRGIDEPEVPRDDSFCGHGINYDGPFIVNDARLDPRFADNPLVKGDPHIRAYAGFPITSPDGHAIGMMCVIDRKPRQFSPAELAQLEALGHEVEKELWSR